MYIYMYSFISTQQKSTHAVSTSDANLKCMDAGKLVILLFVVVVVVVVVVVLTIRTWNNIHHHQFCHAGTLHLHTDSLR